MYYCKDSRHKCIHRKYFLPNITFCSYSLDTNELRGCDPKDCEYWKDTEIKVDLRRLTLPPNKK